MYLKGLILLIGIVVFSVIKAESQQIYFYGKEAKGSWITKEISSEMEVARIDSLVSRVLVDTASYSRKYRSVSLTNYYWNNNDLVCAVYFSEGSNGFHRSEWLFEEGLAIFMRHTVRRKDGKYECRDRYYFSRYKDAIGGRGALVAWYWFGKRVNESSPEYELRFSSLPVQGASVYENGIHLKEDN